jgi:ABC-type anion transport system duplicated permease subunit
LTSQHAQTVRGAYLVMEPAARAVLVPLAFASLLTGIIQSLGTQWGLFRHYRVLFKLLIAVVATIVLLLYLQTFSFMAGVAADTSADLGMVRNTSPRLHAGLALVLLLVATVLAVYKPRGMTRYGRRKQHRPEGESTASTPRWVKVFGTIALVVVLLFVILLFARGPSGHAPGRHRMHEQRTMSQP